jgi:hypothetical protein
MRVLILLLHRVNRQVRPEEGKNLAAEWGCSWVESSARDGSNVDRIFEYMVLEVEKTLNPRMEIAFVIQFVPLTDAFLCTAPEAGGNRCTIS